MLKKGKFIGYIDTTQLYLKKKQLESQIKAMLSKKPNLSVQISAMQSQLAAAENEKIRIVLGGFALLSLISETLLVIRILKK